MVVEGDDSRLTIEVQDRGTTPNDEGDLKLSVSLLAHDFSGATSTWVSGDALRTFIQELAGLESSRKGAAALESMSPGELAIRLSAITNRGHLAVTGRVARRVRGREGGPYSHSVEFGFEIEPTELPAIVAAFRSLGR